MTLALAITYTVLSNELLSDDACLHVSRNHRDKTLQSTHARDGPSVEPGLWMIHTE